MTDLTITTATNITVNGSTYQFIDPHEVSDLIDQLNDLNDQLRRVNNQISLNATLPQQLISITRQLDEVTSAIAMLCVDTNKVA